MGKFMEELAAIFSDTEDEANVLQHFGVGGMRWGVRKSRSSGRSHAPKKPEATKPEVAKPVSDHTRARALQKKGTKHLTTAELKELTTRLQLEKTYAQLQPVTGYKKAMATVKELVGHGTTIENAYKLSKSTIVQDLVKEMDARKAVKAVKRVANVTLPST